MRIELHGQVFNEGPDVDGIAWMVTGMDGWSSPSVRQTTLDPTQKDGAVLTTGFYGTRPVTLAGVVKAPTEALFWKAYNSLLGTTNNLRIDRELLVDEDVRKTLYVVRGAEVRLDFVGVGAITFSIPLTAHDPLKYGAPVTVTLAAGATATITNVGNAASPRMTLTTTASGTLGLTHNGKSTRVYSKVGMSSGTVIDQRLRTVYLGTQNQYHQLSPLSVWWTLDPGANSITNNGSAPLSITYRPAWA